MTIRNVQHRSVITYVTNMYRFSSAQLDRWSGVSRACTDWGAQVTRGFIYPTWHAPKRSRDTGKGRLSRLKPAPGNLERTRVLSRIPGALAPGGESRVKGVYPGPPYRNSTRYNYRTPTLPPLDKTRWFKNWFEVCHTKTDNVVVVVYTRQKGVLIITTRPEF